MAWLKTALAVFFGSIWNRIFPPKTASDVELADVKSQLKDAENAKDIKQQVDGESRADLNADLNKWMRDPN